MRFHFCVSNPSSGWRYESWYDEDGVIEAEERGCQEAGFASARAAREAGYTVIAEKLPPVALPERAARHKATLDAIIETPMHRTRYAEPK